MSAVPRGDRLRVDADAARAAAGYWPENRTALLADEEKREHL